MNWIKKIDWKLTILGAVIVALMILSFLGGTEWLIVFQHSQIQAQLEIGAMEACMPLLAWGIIDRKLADKKADIRLYVYAEVYVTICLVVTNLMSIVTRAGIDPIMDILKQDINVTARWVLYVLFAAPIPVLIIVLIWILVEHLHSKRAEEVKPPAPTWQDISLKDVLQKDVLDKWGKDNGKTARDPGDN